MDLSSTHTRLGIVLASDGSEHEIEGVLNPGIARDRNGALLMYPRVVARGNVSRIALAKGDDRDGTVSLRARSRSPGTKNALRAARRRTRLRGCSSHVHSATRSYVMAYTAFGDAGPRIALALSSDGYAWNRLGLVEFLDSALNDRDNKDAAFFPEPVLSPARRVIVCVVSSTDVAGKRERADAHFCDPGARSEPA